MQKHNSLTLIYIDEKMSTEIIIFLALLLQEYWLYFTLLENWSIKISYFVEDASPNQWNGFVEMHTPPPNGFIEKLALSLLQQHIPVIKLWIVHVELKGRGKRQLSSYWIWINNQQKLGV